MIRRRNLRTRGIKMLILDEVRQLRHCFESISHAVSNSITPYTRPRAVIYLVPMLIVC